MSAVTICQWTPGKRAAHGGVMFVDLQQDWATEIAARLTDDGFARFDGIRPRAQLVTLGASLGRIFPHRDSDDDGVTTLENRGGLGQRIGFEGFSNGALAPHTDRSGVIDPPALLLVVCGRKSASGGECLAIDGRSVYSDLTLSHPGAIEALSRPRTALFGGAAGYLGSVFERTRGGRIRIRLRMDGLVKYSPEIMSWLPALTAAIERHTVRFTLAPGEGYVLHNHRWLHGRAAFAGDRVMYRLSLNPHPEFAIPSGFEIPDIAAVARVRRRNGLVPKPVRGEAVSSIDLCLVELAILRAPDECAPLAGREHQGRAGRVLGVSQADVTTVQPRNLDAIPGGSTLTALEPDRPGQVNIHY